MTAAKLLKGVAGKEQVIFFKGGGDVIKKKLKSEIFNDKKICSKQNYFSLS